jgi:hypothetical protein
METPMQKLVAFVKQHNFNTDDTDINKAIELLAYEKEFIKKAIRFGIEVEAGQIDRRYELDIVDDFLRQVK